MFRNLPNGWRMLAVFPMVMSGEPAGYIVCAEHAVLSGGPLVYVHARTAEPSDPGTWMDAHVVTDSNVAMRRALAASGWSGCGRRHRGVKHARGAFLGFPRNAPRFW
jgi:hypothetical protein